MRFFKPLTFITKGMRRLGQLQEKSEILKTQMKLSETEIHTIIQHMNIYK